MAEIRVKKCRPITAEITVPGDKSISHRAVMMAALANGPCVLDGFLPSEDCMATVRAFRQMAIPISEIDGDDWGPTKLRVKGNRGHLQCPEKAIDCGNSGTTMRLLSGILTGQRPGFEAKLIGDSSLSNRPMDRIIDPLAKMGARIRALGKGDTAPVLIRGANLKAIDYQLPVASAQVKSAILLASLFTEGKTTITEPNASRDHTERMLNFFQVKNLRHENQITIWGGQTLESQDFSIPGDISSAAFWAVAAAAMPGAHLCIKNVGLNETRTGILKTLIRMGAQITEVVETSEFGEPVGHIEIHGGRLQGTVIEGDDIPTVIDEVPIIAIAGALAQGTTVIRDAKELRVKESDRISAITSNLHSMGVSVTELFDGLEIRGGAKLEGAKIDCFGDHRIAMAFAIAGIYAEGETVISDCECIDSSYPGFETQLKWLVNVKNKAKYTPVISSLNPAASD